MSFIQDFTKSAFGSVSEQWSSPAKDLTPGGGAGEGGLPRGGISSGKEVGIKLLDFDSEFEGSNARCGGQIGTGKLCIKQGCDVQSHKKKHKLLQRTGVLVCIEVKHQSDSVFGSPVLALKDFESYDIYKDQLREIEGWESLFSVIQRKAAGLASELSKEEIAELESKAVARTAVTPFKAPSRKLELDLEMEDEFEMVESIAGSTVGLTTSKDAAFETMRLEWDPLVTSVTALRDWAVKSKRQMQELAKELREKNTTTQLEFINIQTMLGARPEDLQGESIFDLLKERVSIKKEPDSLSSSDLNLVMGPIQASIAGINTKLAGALGKIGALESFVGQWTQNAAGDVLFETIKRQHDDLGLAAVKISALESKVATLEQMMVQLQQVQGNSGTGTGLQLGSSVFSQAVNASSASITNPGGSSNLESRMKSCETMCSDLKAQSAVLAVTVRNVTFSSRQETQAWLTLNVTSTDGYLLFIDLHSFLAIISAEDTSSPQNYAKSKAEARKAGFASEMESAVFSSFLKDLPTIFGTESSGLSTKFDTREMPRLPTFDEFGTLSDPAGFSHRFLSLIDQTQASLKDQAEDKLTGPAKQVALHMIGTVGETAIHLSQWMAQQYSDHTQRDTPPKEAWRLVTQSVRSMLSTLHEERKPGRSAAFHGAAPGAPDDHRGHIVWGCLQGFKRLEKIRRHRFEGDSSVYHALFQFLRDQMVLKTTYKKDLDKLRTEISKKENKK